MKLKKILAGVLACCVIGGALPYDVMPVDNAVITANAEATVPSNLTLVGKGSEGDFSCNYYSDGSLLIDGYDGKESVVTIPESINGKKVRSFSVDFYYFGFTITDVNVPSSVALIGSTYSSYTYADAFRIMYDKGITLHMVGYDIPQIEEVPYTYKLSNGTIEITGWDKSATEVVIPSKIYGTSVTSIGDSVFSDCTGLTKITIPDSVTWIGDRVFQNCESLTEIIIPDSVTSIGDFMFYNCKSITKIIIPDSVTSIDEEAFSGCIGLTEIAIPNGVKSIRNNTFSGCKSLTKITIPDSVTEIGGSAFSGCTELTEITIPNSVTSIGSYAFAWCESLTEINIPDSVTSIGMEAFLNCKGLTEITMSDSVTSIDSDTFAYCTSLTSITIPDSVTSIGSNAFKYCESLTEITIPNSVASIGGDAFFCCTELKEITIPNSVKFTKDAFAGCSNLKTLIFADCSNDISMPIPSNANYIMRSLGNNITKVIIPNSATNIDAKAFYECKGLTEITIPDSVTSIGMDAFNGTPWLESKRAENPLVIVNGILIDGYTCSGDVIVPDNVISIGDRAFENCSDYLLSRKGLKNITISDSVKSIGYEAFRSCNVLTSIDIPSSVTNIDKSAFYQCGKLTEITIFNPNCEIYDYGTTINGTATIYGYENSTAQAYAEKYERKFVSLGAAPDNITGDVNDDGVFNVSDVVLLQKWLLAVPNTHIANWKAADLCEDDRLDVFDLCLMKRELLNK